MKDKLFFRVIDANHNRAREGIRVAEDVTRFIIQSPALTRQLKELRQAVTGGVRELLSDRQLVTVGREVETDVGRNSPSERLTRKNYQDLTLANLKRAEESLRVLEEFSKLKRPSAADRFRTIRFNLYRLEKKILVKL